MIFNACDRPSISLLRRFTPHEGSNSLPLTEIHPDTSASDVVSDVTKLVAYTVCIIFSMLFLLVNRNT